MDGMQTALGEITLVLFTTLAPAGAMAYVLMALPLVARNDALDEPTRRRLDNFLSIPIAVAMVGLVASATHLGNPANALYVLTGLGRSPLSNEVVCGVAFLGSAGVFWLTSFAEVTRHPAVRRAVAAVVSVLGLVFIGAISLAYNADTIITWNTPLAPLSVWLNALAGGPLLAILGLRMARFSTSRRRFGTALVAVSAVALIANVAVYIAWGTALPSMENAMTTASALAPAYLPLVGVFAVLGLLGEVLAYRAIRCQGSAPLWLPIVATLAMLVGIFIMRFLFYMIHMTAGLGL